MEGEQNENTQFKVLDTLKLEFNIDRMIEYGESQYLTTSYHLDKDSGLKSGDINILSVDGDKIKRIGRSQVFNFGILSIKHETQNIYSIGCSDGSIQFLEIGEVSNGEFKANLKQTFYAENDEDVCLMHDSNQDQVAAVTSSGALITYDKESAKVIS